MKRPRSSLWTCSRISQTPGISLDSTTSAMRPSSPGVMLDDGGYRAVRRLGNALDCRPMGTFERFTTKTHFNTLKRLVVLVGVAVLAVKLAVAAFWAPAGSPLDL